MKLECNILILNRLLPSLAIKSSTKYVSAVISVVKPSKDAETYVIVFTKTNKTGSRYKIQKNIEKTFGQHCDKGKCTIRFKEPPHDLCISADAIPLKNFMLYVKKVWQGEVKLNPTPPDKIHVTLSKQKPNKLEIRRKKDYPLLHGFPNSIQYLLINDSQLSRFDNRILKLSKLTTLNLGMNKIERIPAELGNLALRELYLNNNNLKHESLKFLSNSVIASTLQTLDLSNNEIKYLPPCLSRFTALRTLNVSKNSLRMIPPRICTLKTLRELDVSWNMLEALPATIERTCLRPLDTLDISGNESLSKPDDGIVFIPRSYRCTRKVNSIFSLLELSGQQIIFSRLNYNEQLIPFHLVRLLDNAGLCSCGKPVLTYRQVLYHTLDAAVIANTFISSDRQRIVPVTSVSCTVTR